MPQTFSQGDKVEWNAGQGTTQGTIQEKIEQPKTVDGQKIAASPDDPRYLVKNDQTGNITGHKPDALNRIGSASTQNKNQSSSSSQNQASSDSQQEFSDQERQDIISEFRNVVNMTPKQLQQWLETEDSQSVGQAADDGEAIGHKSGRHIIEILNKSKSDYTPDDIHHMRRVISYVHRHTAQRPSGDITNTRWRYSLMNWGHDPLK